MIKVDVTTRLGEPPANSWSIIRTSRSGASPGGYSRLVTEPFPRPRRFVSVAELIEHLQCLGNAPSVELADFTELDHGLQTAAHLLEAAPDDLELQVAGLVHDLAHPWDGPGQPRHASMGALAVEDLLGKRVADLIRAHVPAKRYLVSTRGEYFGHLSPDSVMTLAAQGGPMSATETAEFESQTDWRATVELRIADDKAKVSGVQVPSLDSWEPIVRMVAERVR